ncbi:MAG TPA: RodZ domain-containing protein [Terriglobia bacterium]
MSSFGENLRREREMRGVTLEEMSESTKISTRFLRAIELDHFSEIPGGVFTRSFIRTYAQYLGLDEEHVLAEYKRAAQPSVDNDLSRLGPSKPLGSRSGAPTRLLPWVVIAVLLGSGYALYRYAHRPLEIPAAPVQAPAASTASGGALSSSGSAAPSLATSAASDANSAHSSTQAPASNAPNPAASPADGGSTAGAQNNGTATPVNPLQSQGPGNPSGTTPATGAESASTGAPAGSVASPGQSSPSASAAEAAGSSATSAAGGAPTLGEGDLVLQVATSEEVWMAVSADGKTLMQRLLPPRSVRTFRAKDTFDVTTGNAQGTILTLNGETQKPLGREGEFRKLHLTRNDLQHHTP